MNLMSDCVKSAPVLPQLNCVFPLNKPAGISSAKCLAAFKKLGQKKIGHAGTLDPMAEGVLIVLMGQATKLSSWLLNSGKKIYSGSIKLGVETDTWDMEGTILQEKTPAASLAEIKCAVEEWIFLREQDVPAYSAAKQNGQPLYKLARKGKDITAKTKSVQIMDALMLGADLPYVHFRVACSSGVYIRSLAHSLGKRLGCGAALARLTREYSYPFSIEQCASLASLANNPEALLAGCRPMQQALPDWSEVELDWAEAQDALHGRPVKVRAARHEQAKANAFLLHNGKILALAELTLAEGQASWRIKRGMWDQV